MEDSLFSGTVSLAPMVRVCGLGFRQMCLDYGADVVFSEEVVAAKLARCRREVVTYPTVKDPVAEYVLYEPFKKGYKRTVALSCAPSCPSIVQLGVSDPDVGASAALVCCDDVLGFDLNMGCPKKFSIANGFGAALMKDPQRAGRILRSIHLAVNEDSVRERRKGKRVIPISFKTRLLSTTEETVEMVREVLLAAGHTPSEPVVHAITLHAREPTSGADDPPLYVRAGEVARQCRELDLCRGITLVLNGSLSSREDALTRANALGFDGGMMARAALVDPRCFRPPTTQQETPEPLLSVMKDLFLYSLRYRAPFSNFKYHLTRAFPHNSELQPLMQKVQVGIKTYKDGVAFFGLTEEEVSAVMVDVNDFEILKEVPNHVSPPTTSGSKRGREDS